MRQLPTEVTHKRFLKPNKSKRKACFIEDCQRGVFEQKFESLRIAVLFKAHCMLKSGLDFKLLN